MREGYCEQSVHNGSWIVSFHQCRRKATREYQGKRYCGTHYPPNVDARRKKGDEESRRKLAYRLSAFKEQRKKLDVGDMGPQIVAALEAALRDDATVQEKDEAQSILKKLKKLVR